MNHTTMYFMSDHKEVAHWATWKFAGKWLQGAIAPCPSSFVSETY